ncbi:MAG: asparagine synthase (glutamine-hydrolyzing), partial [Epsilonproteobacteria bacterium]|nr:asparagine synthase (glutamine-hydrolyzing) [Campylobacterota bacterium]
EFYQASNYSLGLGHRRLSILDLSPLGSQPMYYKELTIIHNGEVYNFAEIKTELMEKGYEFTSHTDTEVILKAFHAWGVKCVDKFRGMFAFAIYNKGQEELYIFRDRAGVKPLYYHQSDDLFLFGSELKSFYQHPNFKKIVNKQALPYYFRFGYIPAPLTIFENTHKLKAGHYLVVNTKDNSYEEKCYWSVEEAYIKEKLQDSEEEIMKRIEDILTESCELRMVSDVPVGVFLSGGVDSSLVASLLQKNSKTPLKTFTIGFEEKNYNEATFAKEIAEHLGTEHTEYYCSKNDMLEVIKDLPFMYDEPFGDSSAIPTFLVSKLAKEKVSVVLSGDGGDEAFVGYSKYFALEKIGNLQDSKIKKRLLQTFTKLISEESVEKINNLLPTSKKQKNIKDKYQKFKNVVNSNDFSDMFINASSYVDKETLKSVLIDSSIDFELTNFASFKKIDNLSALEQMSIIDYKTYMADDILTKVDRASMTVSIEAREPLIDHKIIEFSAQVPDSIKYHKNIGKYLLKQVLYKHVPKELIERPKSGFQVPLYEWLRDDLREELDYYLSRDRLIASGIYNVDEVLKIKERLYKGKTINLSLLWFILMFEMWRERWEV